jgi:hypothetical protein
VLLGVKTDRGELVFRRKDQRLRPVDGEPPGRSPEILLGPERKVEAEAVEVDLEKKLALPVIGRVGPVESRVGEVGPVPGDGGFAEARLPERGFDGRPVPGMDDAVDVAERPEPRIRVDGQGQPGPLDEGDPGPGSADGREEGSEEGEETDVPPDVSEIVGLEPLRPGPRDRRREVPQVPVNERGRPFVDGRGFKRGPVRAGFDEVDGLPLPRSGRVGTRAEEKKSGGRFRDYFLTLNGDVSFSSIVVSVALPATTEAMPRGSRKNGGTPFLQTT